jgi:hypothetical protein
MQSLRLIFGEHLNRRAAFVTNEIGFDKIGKGDLPLLREACVDCGHNRVQAVGGKGKRMSATPSGGEAMMPISATLSAMAAMISSLGRCSISISISMLMLGLSQRKRLSGPGSVSTSAFVFERMRIVPCTSGRTARGRPSCVVARRGWPARGAGRCAPPR